MRFKYWLDRIETGRKHPNSPNRQDMTIPRLSKDIKQLLTVLLLKHPEPLCLMIMSLFNEAFFI